jgi:hypothetical protein
MKEAMKEAIKELKDKLGKLAVEIKELGEEYKGELKPIHEAFAEMNLEEMEVPGNFLKDLVSLSKAVLKISYREKSSPLYGKLTLPPYDLFLPFKSKDLAENENENLSLLRKNDLIDIKEKYLKINEASMSKNQDPDSTGG